jgi:DNA-binding CsgD family transcriptional regulator
MTFDHETPFFLLYKRGYMPKANKDVLESYYKLWLSGKTPSQIKKLLKLTDRNYKSLLPDFLSFCRHKIQFEPRDALAVKNKSLVKIELTKEREIQFLQYVASGLSYDDAALLMDVPLATVFNFWFLESPAFKLRCEKVTKFITVQATMALYKRVVGYDVPYEKTSKSSGINKDGEPFDSETVTTGATHIAPDVNAAKFWLFNRDPANWTIDGMRTGKGQKGKILEFIEAQGETLTEDEMRNYDDAQAVFDDQHHKEK